MDKKKLPDSELQKQVDDLREVESRNRLKWALIAGTITVIALGLTVAFIEYREFFFRPKPDMSEVERVAFSKTNDPACRALIDNLDSEQKDWKARGLELQAIDQSSDVTKVRAARDKIAAMIAVYDLEERRLETIVVRDPNVRGDMAQFIRHVLHYLRKMDKALEERIAELDVAPAGADAGATGDAGTKLAVPGLGDVEVAKSPTKADDSKPVVDYKRAWSMITEDQDKWRVFRQAQIPCGRRDGAVPPIPSKARDLSGPLRKQKGTIEMVPKTR